MVGIGGTFVGKSSKVEVEKDERVDVLAPGRTLYEHGGK